MAVIKSVEEKYMKEALKQAKKAYALGEVPIGCVIVHEGKIIGRYDKMIGKFTGQDTPAVGFSIGFERIVMLLMERGNLLFK